MSAHGGQAPSSEAVNSGACLKLRGLQILCILDEGRRLGPLQTNNALSVEPGREQRTTMKRRKKTDPTTRLIEAMLDIALLAGFIFAMGFLVRLAF